VNAATAGGPLSGITVIEVGRYIAAPFAGRQLAAMGVSRQSFFRRAWNFRQNWLGAA